MPSALQAVSVGAVILFVVVATPMLVDSATNNAEQTLQFDEGETIQVTDRLNLTNERIRPPSPENATFTLRDTQSLESQTQTIQNGSQATYAFDGGNATVSVENVRDATTETTTVTVRYPTDYGWSDGAQTLADNLGLILVVVAFIVVVGLLRSVIQ